METDPGFLAALEEARLGFTEGGIPIGAALVSADGKILGRGHNLRVQKSSPIIHGEMAALNDAGRLPASIYRGCTMYSTLSPCDMCAGACILYRLKRVVVGENKTFIRAEDHLRKKGIEVVVLDNAECMSLMKKFIQTNPDEWSEDIGETTTS